MGKSGLQENKYFWQRKKSRDTSTTRDLLNKTDAENGERPAEVDEVQDGFTPPDGGWGWIVCLTSLWANGTVFGIINTFGIMYVQMREHYSKGDSEVSLKTAFVGSTCTGVTFFMCTVSSILSDRIGIRPTAVCGAVLATIGLVTSAFIERLELLYLTYGLILGIGSSMVYSPSLVILGHYFKKHMGLVNGIVAFGSSVFTIALTRILPYLLGSIGIKYCFLFLAGMQAMLILFAFSWKPLFRKEDQLAVMTLSTESVYEHCNVCCTWTKRFLNVKIWRNRAYVTWVVSLGVALFGYFVPFFHLPKYTADTFPEHDGSWLILCLSITSGISRIICGKLADIPWISRIKLQQGAFVVLGVSTMCIPFAQSFEGLIAISLAMGVCDGIFVCLLGPIAFDIVGPAEASQAIGFLLGLFSVPFTCGPPFAGWLYDTMGNYRVAFHIAGAPPILGAIIMFFIPKVEQSFPAVTETMEFASMSVVDIYNEVKVPKDKQTSRAHHQAGGPSAELELIQSSDLLYLGSSPPRAPNIVVTSPTDEEISSVKETKGQSDGEGETDPVNVDPVSETTPMMKMDFNENTENQNDNQKEESSEVMNENDESDSNENKKSPSESNMNQNGCGEADRYESDAMEGADDVDMDNQLDYTLHQESSSLMEEVGKYFDANRVSVSSDPATTL